MLPNLAYQLTSGCHCIESVVGVFCILISLCPQSLSLASSHGRFKHMASYYVKEQGNKATRKPHRMIDSRAQAEGLDWRKGRPSHNPLARRGTISRSSQYDTPSPLHLLVNPLLFILSFITILCQACPRLHAIRIALTFSTALPQSLAYLQIKKSNCIVVIFMFSLSRTMIYELFVVGKKRIEIW